MTHERAAEVVDLLRERGERLVVVESCTGGLLGAKITSAVGSSDVFAGGWITYANEMKTGAVGVDAEVLKQEGAVSRAVAQAMARGALNTAPQLGVLADHALAITGIAGPGGGSDEKPVGTVWIALSSRIGGDLQDEARRFLIPGARDDVRERSAVLALAMLWRRLRKAGGSGQMLWQIE